MVGAPYIKSDVSVVGTSYFLSYMPIFYKIASIKSGNRNVKNVLPVSRDKGRSVTSIHYVQSISHNVIKQGLTSVVDVCTSLGGVTRIGFTADDEVSSLSPATHHQLLQLLGRWGYSAIIWETGRSENNLPRSSTT